MPMKTTDKTAFSPQKRREIVLKAIRFERPDYIPMIFSINGACWNTYPHEALFELMESHPLLFPDFVRPAEPFVPHFGGVASKDHPFTDDWGCLWTTSMDGITGTVTKHPLADWADFASYPIPDPSKCTGLGPIDWEAERRHIADLK